MPRLHCGLKLKNVSRVECGPFPVEKCGNVAKDIPYITMENQCDEIVYDECQEVRRKLD